MNSKQRRQLERKTKYKITLTRGADESWVTYDFRSDDAVEWVKKNAKGEYVIKNRFAEATFQFQKESDAVIFGLKWI